MTDTRREPEELVNEAIKERSISVTGRDMAHEIGHVPVSFTECLASCWASGFYVFQMPGEGRGTLTIHETGGCSALSALEQAIESKHVTTVGQYVVVDLKSHKLHRFTVKVTAPQLVVEQVTV